MVSVSVIIPTFNEGERILPVANTIIASKICTEVIIVDDSSDKDSKDQLEKIQGATIIELKENKGKSHSLKVGFENSSGDIVVFIDADLKNFTSEHLRTLVNKVQEGYDMVLGELEYEFPIFRLLGMSIALTGERAFRRKSLEENLEIFQSKGYFIESKMNSIFFRKEKVGRVILYGVGQEYKVQKIGVKGWFNDMGWLFKYVTKVGLKEVVFQLVTAKKKIKLLN